MILVCLGTVVVGGLGYGLWKMVVSYESESSSLQTLTSNAIDAAAEMSTVLRENVTRDAARLAELIRGSDEDEATDEEAVEEPEIETAEAAPSPVPVRRREPPTFTPVPSLGPGSALIAARPELPPLPGVFDNTSPGVTPPGTEHIRIRTVEPGGVPVPEGLSVQDAVVPQKPSQVEVIVSPYGRVERAKLISAPEDIHEAMILSAIKAWQFTPALKDGHPVRYRLVLPVEVALGGQVVPPSDLPSAESDR